MSGSNLVGLGGTNSGARNGADDSLNLFNNKNIWRNSFGFGSTSTSKTGTSSTTARTGSSALLDDSVSDGWNRSRNTPSSRIMGNSAQAPSRPQTSIDSAQQGGGVSLGSNFFPTSRPPTINLNSTAGHQPKPSHGNGFSNALPFGQSEQAPAVYTKFDRPAAPQYQSNGFDVVSRSHQGSANQSPSEERRSFIGSAYAHHSMPGSRNSSLPPSRHGEEVQQQTWEMAAVGRPGPDSFRRQSTPHANVMLGNSNDQVNRASVQFGQMSFGDHRASQSFSTNGDFSHSHDSSSSDVMLSRRSSRQVETPQSFMMNGFVPSYMNGYGMDQSSNQTPARMRSDPTYMSNFDARTGSITSSRESRRDSAQSRDLQISNGLSVNAMSWGQVDQRLRQHQMMQQMDPNLAQYLRVQNAPYVMNMQAMQTPGQYFHQGAVFSVNPGLSREPSVSHTFRSALLDDFRNTKSTKKHELREILGQVVEFSGDQHGSRFIQTKLETANSDEKARVFDEILPECHQLMIDVFGNYVIQKFFEHGDQTQKKILAHRMRGHVLQLTVQMYGCRVVQKALEHVLNAEKAMLVSELKADIIRCVKDQNGNHVIQKAIEVCTSDMIPFIFDAFKGQVPSLSGHSYGCRVIQRCLEHAEADIKRVIMSELSTSLTPLIPDQFGNYVVQHVVLHGEPQDRKLVVDIISNSFEQFSKHKFASNVVEKCLMHGGEDFQRGVVRQMVQGQNRPAPQDSMILGLIKDSYGNYVIQKMCEALTDSVYVEFVEQLHPEISKARRMGCGKQVSAIEKKMNRPTTFPKQRSGNNATYASRAVSGERTPALTTSNSAQTSSLSSVNGDAVEGATNSRKNSVHGNVNHR
ncbi:mRNA-binding protein puf3-like protein [Elsinoe fawcettii]|nr:mRNA-binding protein puf3-like protein [Elsinoe fawcettii]